MQTIPKPPAVSKMVCFFTPAIILSVTPAYSAYDAFLKIEGVDGESTAKGYEKWIRIESFSWGASQSISFGSGGREAGKVAITDLSLTKRVDRSSPALFLKTAKGDVVNQVELRLVRTDSKGNYEAPFYQIKLDDVIISSVQTSGGAGADDRPGESISFNFSKIEVGYAVAGGGMQSVSWNIATNSEK